MTRQIFLDTETTGINKIGGQQGHRIIEIGAVEVINRSFTGRIFHVYLKPDRPIDEEAFKVHGISNEFLINKKKFKNIANELLSFIRGTELVIHNASFDIGFLDYEFGMLNSGIEKIDTLCKITDSLVIARKIFPGKHNSLKALCDRYLIDKSKKRTLHGALLDAEILAEVFLMMTSGQRSIGFTIEVEKKNISEIIDESMISKNVKSIKIIYASNKEIMEHENILNILKKNSGKCFWLE